LLNPSVLVLSDSCASLRPFGSTLPPPPCCPGFLLGSSLGLEQLTRFRSPKSTVWGGEPYHFRGRPVGSYVLLRQASQAGGLTYFSRYEEPLFPPPSYDGPSDEIPTYLFSPPSHPLVLFLFSCGVPSLNLPVGVVGFSKALTRLVLVFPKSPLCISLSLSRH